ncbi:MAG: putative hydroxymethylpyrimidine transporter CytX [Firmicutes bacterium]|nr:putative hydroxymethylpyrimidine transporter CytX [Bacillota bacterium]
MATRKTSVFGNGLVWFGAAVSLAEILSGTYLAPLGFSKGLLSIILGHIIGCILLFLAGYIGGKTEKSAMQTVQLSFGIKGSYLFALLNVIQLTGWTAIMIYDGALAANGVFAAGQWIWAVVIGGLIVVWILIGLASLGKVNVVAMSGLMLLTIILCFIIFGKDGAGAQASGEAMSFGAAMELSIAMPLSWLPLISDYTREAEKPVRATAVSAIVYGLVSSWMYVIGMGAAIFTGTIDIAQIMLKAGLGIAGLLIVILSTVTTTFLDAYSAGVSSEVFSEKIKGKWVAVVVTVIGTVLAILFPMENISNFLYFIGSVFAPMISIQIVDYFILKHRYDSQLFCVHNLVIWLIGFGLYRWLMRVDMIIGSTIACMAITMVLTLVVGLISRKGKVNNENN